MRIKILIKFNYFSIIALLLIAVCVMSTGAGAAITLTVDDSGSAMFSNIQDAINAASSGDTIYIYEGIYFEQITISKNQINLVGENINSTIIVGPGGDAAISITSDNVVLNNLTIINYDNIGKSYQDISGIRLDHSNNNQIYNINSSYNGYGIELIGSSNNIIADSYFTNNIISDVGYGILLESESNNNIIKNNTIAWNDKGIKLSHSKNNSIIYNTMFNQSWPGFGIEFASGSKEYFNNTIESNTVNRKKLIYVFDTHDYSINNLEIGQLCLAYSSNITVDNNSFLYGTVYFIASNSSTFSNNSLSYTAVGLILMNSSQNILIKNDFRHSLIDIWLGFSNNNKIYLNNFNISYFGVVSFNSTNIWNSTEQISYQYNDSSFTNYLGNYWTIYTEIIDEDGNGIGDSPFIIGNPLYPNSDKDYYPLMLPWNQNAKDSIPPTLTIISPTNESIISTSSIYVTGTASDNVGVTYVTVNDEPVTLTNGLFNTTISLTSGINSITVVAADAAGNSATEIITVTYLVTEPLLVFAITPNSRLAQVNSPVTIFLSAINAGTATATDVSISQASSLPATISYQTWDGATLTSTPDIPVDIGQGETANFVLTITPTAEFASSSMTFDVSSTNGATASISGVNTLTLSASSVPYADVIMISTALDVSTPVNNPTAFAVATTNVGTADATGVSLVMDIPSSITGLSYEVYETYPNNGSIKGPATGLTIPVGAQPTFAVFLTPTQAISFDPANNRIMLKLVDGSGKVVGAQSVSVSTAE